ncbi:restriction endonuclease subunit S [Faecalibacterium prausnitzii]|uniref:restriction endonuclease subunit S n=1 Tax=Faecalibacterium prausnitzii TaxID=853 RepID=UPI001F1C6620|nr:restriction endonuclease subunit S [Faecalibacterium prausnitzii]
MARKMKDSGIEWIGEIPEGWEIKRLGAILQERNEVNNPIQTTSILSLTNNRGVIPYSEKGNQGNKAKDDLTGYKIAHIGDIVLNSMNVIIGSVGLSNYYGAVSPVYYMLFPRNNIETNIQYYNYLFQTTAFQQSLRGYGNGILEIRMRIQMQKLKTVLLPVPTFLEQSNITVYLDASLSKLNILLSKTRSSIEEYKKLKQAVITQAVTKGVRGERGMKDSGVEWIGEIPKEWRETQLRHCATIKSGITLGKSYRKDTVLIERPYLRVANVQGGYVDLNDLATIEVTPDEDLKYRLHSGDVLMTEGGDRDKLGRGCVWHGEIEPCLHQNHVFAVQTNETILLPEFLEYLTASDVGRSYFDITAIKTTNLACTSSSKVLAFTIPLPPVEEQIEIVSFIKKRSLELNKLIMKKELLVQELESYKKSLIYEVVTGKREV